MSENKAEVGGGTTPQIPEESSPEPPWAVVVKDALSSSYEELWETYGATERLTPIFKRLEAGVEALRRGCSDAWLYQVDALTWDLAKATDDEEREKLVHAILAELHRFSLGINLQLRLSEYLPDPNRDKALEAIREQPGERSYNAWLDELSRRLGIPRGDFGPILERLFRERKIDYDKWLRLVPLD